jgi:hypothetical protein
MYNRSVQVNVLCRGKHRIQLEILHSSEQRKVEEMRIRQKICNILVIHLLSRKNGSYQFDIQQWMGEH